MMFSKQEKVGTRTLQKVSDIRIFWEELRKRKLNNRISCTAKTYYAMGGSSFEKKEITKECEE